MLIHLYHLIEVLGQSTVLLHMAICIYLLLNCEQVTTGCYNVTPCNATQIRLVHYDLVFYCLRGDLGLFSGLFSKCVTMPLPFVMRNTVVIELK